MLKKLPFLTNLLKRMHYRQILCSPTFVFVAQNFLATNTRMSGLLEKLSGNISVPWYIITGVFLNLASKQALNCRLLTHYTGYGSRISCLNLTLLHEWCDLNRLSNAYFDAKLKKNTLYMNTM
jgi:hypothetical protein